jgi:hypothetical protein
MPAQGFSRSRCSKRAQPQVGLNDGEEVSAACEAALEREQR